MENSTIIVAVDTQLRRLCLNSLGKKMNGSFTSSLACAFLLFAGGCVNHREALSTTSYVQRMAAMEKSISDSSTFADFERDVRGSQMPAFYTAVHFRKFAPASGADLVSMRSATRKSAHEVLIHGAARTKACEGVRYWIAIDEAVKSK